MPSSGERSAYYNQHLRDPEARRFYNSTAWKTCRAAYIREHPICERCTKVVADHVHHRVPIDTPEGWERRLNPTGFMSVCRACHNVVESQTPQPQPVMPIGTITITEDTEFYFDAEAAEKPIDFIQKYCRHFQGLRFAGKPFLLLEWQRKIIRTLFGWKSRATHLRRFRELYLISAKGAGKTPLFAAIGLFMLLADGEPAAHVVSLASTFEQANLTFGCAKTYVEESPELKRHPGINCKQYIIEGPRHSKWTTVSGKPNGRSGPQVSCIIADEAHEWPAATGIGFDLLCANLFKRSQPLLLVATNAAADRNGYAWTLHERAVGVLAGTAEDKTLLPVIFEAPKKFDWRSEEAARAANPSIPDVVTFSQIQPEQSKGEARYRRLYLSQWVTGSDKWIDMGQWSGCTQPLDTKAVGLCSSHCSEKLNFSREITGFRSLKQP